MRTENGLNMKTSIKRKAVSWFCWLSISWLLDCDQGDSRLQVTHPTQWGYTSEANKLTKIQQNLFWTHQTRNSKRKSKENIENTRNQAWVYFTQAEAIRIDFAWNNIWIERKRRSLLFFWFRMKKIKSRQEKR